MKDNPWADRFGCAWSDPELDQLINIPAQQLLLGERSIEVDSLALRAGLQSFFISSEQIRLVVRQLYDAGYAHSNQHFTSIDQVVNGLYSVSPWQNTDKCKAICLTGLAGVGKSALIAAWRRIMPAPVPVGLPGIHGIRLVAAWFLNLRDGASPNALLRPWIEPTSEIRSDLTDMTVSRIKDKHLKDLLPLSRRIAWRDGVCLLFIDEFQFITASTVANARAANVLLQMMGLGPQVVFCANFSLVHRLRRRDQPERDRFLASPTVVLPERQGSLDWKKLLEECKKVAPDVFDFAVEDVSEIIHQYTFGIKRKVVELLTGAYRLARLRSIHAVVGLDTLKIAYLSTGYTMHREDVEILWKQQIGKVQIREDLCCPFDLNEDPTNVTFARAAIDQYEKRIDDAILESSLTPREADALMRLKPEVKSKSLVKVIRMPRQKVTKESLIAAGKALDGSF